ncbi:MFS transporter (macronuclear) [Tetrahymena thermophila SB210]|uniref:MFS transporter n=1 Tax=Tetrahymena thermophila (strain SB210) TaxID=312017 RepID=I7M0K8_TETTS|nr:MFS transporter [Tetrahymena thermophila SB210]EAR89304.1 MFS transporter [Tetrahymena thermophila SB210]|eukprot:XP_001009549.1 MFS transporter [Tetrahymena thermophila SB210]
MFNVPAVTYLQEKNMQHEEQKKNIKKHFLMVNILGKMEAFLETGNMIGPIIGGILFKQGGSFAVFVPICCIELILLFSFVYFSKSLDQKLKAAIQSATTLPELVSQKNNLEFTANNVSSNNNSVKLSNEKNKLCINDDQSSKDFQHDQSSIKNIIHQNEFKAKQINSKDINMIKINFNIKIFLTGIVIFLPLFSQSFIDPSLSLFLEDQFGMNEIQSGYFFLSNALSFIIATSIISQYLTKNVNHSRITSIICLILKGSSFVMYGPDKILGINPHIAISIMCSIVIGFSIGNILVSQNKVLSFVISRELLDYSQEQQLYIISILYNMYQDFGWLSGPLIGGVMTNYLDFPRASSIIGLINLSYTVLYLIFFKLPLLSTIFPQKNNQLQTKQEQGIPTFSCIQQVENRDNKYIQHIKQSEIPQLTNFVKQKYQKSNKLLQIHKCVNNKEEQQHSINISSNKFQQTSQKSIQILQNDQALEPSVSDRSIINALSQNQLSRYQERQDDENIIIEGAKDQQAESNKHIYPELDAEESLSPTLFIRNSSRIKRKKFSLIQGNIKYIINNNNDNKIQQQTNEQSNINKKLNFDDNYYNTNSNLYILNDLQSSRKSLEQIQFNLDCVADKSTTLRFENISQTNQQISQQLILDETFSPTIKYDQGNLFSPLRSKRRLNQKNLSIKFQQQDIILQSNPIKSKQLNKSRL